MGRRNAVQVSLTDLQRDRIDAFRRAHADPPTRAVAIQRLLDQAISKFIDDDVVAQAKSMPSLQPPRMGRPPKRASLHEETVTP
jgi:hypothetical protein